eukprot:6924676-Prymnesium_polylepis.2
MSSTVRLLTLVVRRRLTLLTAAGLLARMPSADGTVRPSHPVRTQASIGVTSISRTDNSPTVWRTADGQMCS